MSQIDEDATADTPMGGVLQAGVNAISIQQKITFTKYREMILPIDGYRFWVRAIPAQTWVVQGSLHYASDTLQQPDEVYTANRVVFTSLEEVFKPNTMDRSEIWIGEFDGLMFGFNSRSSMYRQANIFHYVGFAIYADMQTQIVKNPSALLTDQQIVSNSMPLWLEMNGYRPVNLGAGIGIPTTLYPAMLSPQNLAPPYATVDISPDSAEALAAAPSLSSTGTHDQLCTETVKLTTWGLRNADALTLVDAINAYSLNVGTFGIMNMPMIRDERRAQSETSTLAQKKSVTFQISYYQYTARAVARKLIEAATATMIMPS